MQVAAGGIVRQQTIFSGSIHRTQRSKRLMYAPSIVHRAQLAINPHYAHLATKFERFRCELNRNKSKFEREACFRQLSIDVLSVVDRLRQ